MSKRILAVTGAALAAVAGVALASGTALATPATITASTHVSNAPDSGNNGNWAYDDYTRVLTVKVDPDQSGAPAGDTVYLASISDHGQFHAILGAFTPNQAVPGLKITHSVSGSMNGSATYVVTAPAADTLTAAGIPATVDDNFAGGTGNQTTGNWPKLAFTDPATVTATLDNDWTWTYTRACEAWTDAAANGDGNLAGDGNITGKLCVPPPHVYDVDVRDGRRHHETVTWHQAPPSADTVTLNGPGFWHDTFSVTAGTDYLALPRLREHSWYSVTVQAAGGNSATTWFRTGR
jgi:hypothetical protein